jgi:hypothetical protein
MLIRAQKPTCGGELQEDEWPRKSEHANMNIKRYWNS